MTRLKLVKTYRNLLKKHFILIQSVQTGTLMLTGDLLAQTVIERKKQINLGRATNFLLFGVGIAGPALTMWYKFLSNVVGRGGGKAVVLKKVALDQFLFAPISLCGFLIIINKLQGKSWKFVQEEIEDKYCSILVTNYSVWPFIQLVNFYAVPLRHQVLFVQSIAIFWNAYLSWKSQNYSNIHSVP